MNNAITVTASNFPAVNRAERLLRSHRGRLVQMTGQYPVECTFAGYRFIFRSQKDIDDLIAIIDREMAEYRRSAARIRKPTRELALSR